VGQRALEAVTSCPRHDDPFDRILIAQADIEEAALVTRDPEIRKYKVDIIW
jgi:PIN domain nuclease of toxin-antitoxin system